MTTLAVTSTLVAGLAAAPTLFAHDSEGSGGLMMGRGMMGQGGMMGGGNMTGMMNMMGQMNTMMENCNQMMQRMMGNHGSEKPNEQWQKEAPLALEEKS